MGLVDETNVIDLSIPAIEKKKYRINGDNDKILELNTSDANIITRLTEGYDKLVEYGKAVAELSDAINEEDDTEESMQALSEKLKEIDTQMKEIVDYIFDANVSEVCAGNASMYDPLDGKFRWEHIIESIGSLFEKSFVNEFKEMQKHTAKHTDKYTNTTSTKKKGKSKS